MKKVVAVGLVAIMAVGLTGCGDKIKLTTEQNDLIAEYVAGTMLKYSYDNEWKYTKLKVAQNTYVPQGQTSAVQQPTTSAGNGTTASSSTTSVSNKGTSLGTTTTGTANENPMTSLPSTLGLTNVSITVKDVVAGASYPTDSLAIAVPATSGNKVVAVEFNLKNDSGSEVTLNTTSSSVNMKLTISGNNFSQSTSILKNDINGLKNISLAAGDTYTAVAIFQVEESVADQASSGTLTVNSGSASLGTLSLK